MANERTDNDVIEDAISDVESMRDLISDIKEDLRCIRTVETRKDVIANLKEAKLRAIQLIDEIGQAIDRAGV